MKCRKNVRNLSDTEKRDFVRACNMLKAEPSILNPGNQSRYDDFARVHLDAMSAVGDWTHGDSAFFPWHREMIYQFELELDRMVPGVTIPYWDWTRHHETSDDGFPFTYDFIGVDGDDSSGDQVEREPGAPSPYPHEFDPEDWDIVVSDNPTDPARLIRRFAERSDAPQLPENDIAVPFTTTSFRDALAAPDYEQLREDSEGDHHNLVHRWVAGNMVQAASPNDPVFFMHHANIDRMWTIWQENNPGLPPYVNTSGAAGHGLNDTMIFHFPSSPAPWAGTARPSDVIDAHTMHGDSVWYESDMPEIFEVPSGTLDFGAVPEDMTQYRAARFRVRTCRPMRFRITGLPDNVATNFDVTPLGTEVPVTPNATPGAQDVYVWFQFTASGPSIDANATIEADFLDDEGYYAATEGGSVPIGSWNVTLTATVQPREDNSVVFVLDRSGSMGAAAGGGSTRSALMKSAVSTFHALMAAGDEIGVVSFDDMVDDLLPLTDAGAGLGTTLTGPGLDPRGNTAIGQGIQLGATMLSGASHSNRSMVVLTDGNENVPPYVTNLPAGTVTNRTYAVGFGLPGHVSDAVLNEITSNTGGDLIISGELTSQDDAFLLTKYFVQILAGVTSANIVLDPGGALAWGSKHVIPFHVTGTDLEVDVICLSGLPQIIDLTLETQSGDMIRPSDAGALPNVSYKVADGVGFYRMKLPALPGNPAKSHAGVWKAHIALADRDRIRKLLSSNETLAGLDAILRAGTLPYHLIVHTRSNLTFSASLTQASLEPGATLALSARLMEYAVPYRGSAEVRGEVTRPDGSETTVTLDADPGDPGAYTACLVATAPGIYRVRVLASGASSAGGAFTREKTLTASVFRGGDRPRIDPNPDDDETHLPPHICRLLDCLLSDESVRKWFKRQELDQDAIAKCLMSACRKAGVDTRGARTIRPEKRLEMDRIAAAVRKELLAIDPEKMFAKAAGPTKAKTPPEAERSEHPMKEHFMPTKRALERMKKEEATKSKSRKKK